MSPASVMPKPKKELLLKTALAYAALGMAVFPCFVAVHREGKPVSCSCNRECDENIGKHPLTQHGLKDASADEAKIRQWWSKFPFANIGIRTGGGFIVVDLDPKHNGVENWEEVSRGKELPATAECITGSGGRHIYYRIPEGKKIANSASKIAPGVDVRGDGGYVIAPPSLHKSGRHYEWELSNDLLEGGVIASAPEWLLSTLETKELPPRPAVGSGGIGGSKMFEDGKRNTGLYKLGLSMRGQGFGDAAVKSAIWALNETQCNPPIEDPKEVETIIAQVCKVPPGMSKEVAEKLAAKEARAKATAAAGPAVAVAAATPESAPANAASPPKLVAQTIKPRIKIARPTDDSEDDVLERGDHTELAHLLLSRIQGNVNVSPVSNRDELWRFVPENGLWQTVSLDKLVAIVAEFAGMSVAQGKGTKPLKLRHGDMLGIIKTAKALVVNDAFFDDAASGIAFSNGFVSVSEKGDVVLSPLTPEHKATASMSFNYDPDAPCPRWIRFLEEVFTKLEVPEAEPGDGPEAKELFEKQAKELKEKAPAMSEDRQLCIAMLQEHAGSCLVGSITKFAVAMTLVGEGSNGKSVYLSVIQALFPHNSIASVSPQEFKNKPFLAELATARLNAVNEMPDSEIESSKEWKEVVAGDVVTARRLYGHPFQFKPIAGHLFACNTLPPARDLSDGFWRRFMVVQFVRTFSVQEREIGLSERIIRSELPGIAAWAIQGAANLHARGSFRISASSLAARQEWKQDSDQVAQFLSDATKEDQHATIRMVDGYASYRFWCRRTGHQSLSERKFSQRLKRLMVQKNGTNGRYYEGRRIIEEFVPPDPGADRWSSTSMPYSPPAP